MLRSDDLRHLEAVERVYCEVLRELLRRFAPEILQALYVDDSRLACNLLTGVAGKDIVFGLSLKPSGEVIQPGRRDVRHVEGNTVKVSFKVIYRRTIIGFCRRLLREPFEDLFGILEEIQRKPSLVPESFLDGFP